MGKVKNNQKGEKNQGVKDKKFAKKKVISNEKKQKRRNETQEDIHGEDDDTLTLDIVKELGGDEEDLKLLETMGNDDAHVEVNKETDNDLKNLIKTLNFSQFKQETFIIKDKEEEVSSDKVQDEEISSSSDAKSKSQAKSSSNNNENVRATEDVAEENEEDSAQSHSFSFIKDKSSARTQCVIKTGEKWFSALTDETSDAEDIKSYWLNKVEKYTRRVWDMELENYKRHSQSRSRRSETQWIQTVLKSGTLDDKFNAYVLLLQDSPVHNVAALETLIDFVHLKSRRPCLMAIDALQHLFLEVLLHPTRKLRNFEQNPFSKLSVLSGGNRDTIDRYLISWMFEDKVKKLYVKFLDNLELVGKDSIDKTKVKALSSTLEMLAGNPEQESVLLSRLVNKLGDPSRKIASKAMDLLSQLLERHPVMKWVVVSEVERLLYRPNIADRAQYFGICFLNQIILEKFHHDK